MTNVPTDEPCAICGKYGSHTCSGKPDPTPAPDAVKWVPHVIEEGSRKHVISYHGTVDGAKRVCNVPNCEINRPRKSSDDNSASADRRQQEVFGAGQDAGRPGPNAGGGDAGAIQGADHQRGASVIRERGRPFPLLIDNEVLKAQILADPDDEPTAGNLPDPAPTPAPDAVIEPSKLVAAIKVQLSSAQVALLSGKPERYRGPLVWLNIYGREAVKRIEDLEEQLRDALRDADILADMAQPTSSDPDYLVAELRATHCSNDGLHDKAAAEIVALRERIAELERDIASIGPDNDVLRLRAERAEAEVARLTQERNDAWLCQTDAESHLTEAMRVITDLLEERDGCWKAARTFLEGKK